MDFELIGIGVFAFCGCVFFILFLIWFQGTSPHESQADASEQDTKDAEESMIMSSGAMDAGNLACHSNNSYFSVKRLSRSLTAERSALIMPCILRELSFEQIEAATGKFSSSCIIKRGHSGDFYKGVLEGGEVVIIKRICMKPLQDQLVQSKDLYFAEMDIYGKVLDQRFLVPVLGHCLAKEEKFLVYEYMPYGDLASILANSRASASPNNPKSCSSSRKIEAAVKEILKVVATQEEQEDGDTDSAIFAKGNYPFKACRLGWPVRMRIAREVAAALAYLHHECRPPLSHRNIKSSSILLNKELEMRLGSMGDTQKIESGEVPAYDIYCFGRLLLDLISGLDISGMKCTRDEEAQAWISKCFHALTTSIKGPLLQDLIDKVLILQEHHLSEILQVAKLAKLCMEPTTLQKLSMKKVLHMLPSFNSSQRAPPCTFF